MDVSFELCEIDKRDDVVVVAIASRFIPTVVKALKSYREDNGRPLIWPRCAGKSNPAVVCLALMVESSCAVLNGDDIANHPKLPKDCIRNEE